MKRNEIIRRAYRKLALLPPGREPNVAQLREGVEALSLIVQEEDTIGGSGDATRSLWAQESRGLILKANQATYTRTEGATDADLSLFSGLAQNVVELLEVIYRPGTSGTDCSLRIINAREYTDLPDKGQVGTPRVCYLRVAALPPNHELLIHPVVAAVGSGDKVVGEDGITYVCIKRHTATIRNQPPTGSDWRLYWDPQQSDGVAWVDGTIYTAPDVLWYTYKRSLVDFDGPNDNPDFPKAWDRYLVFRLAFDLSFESAIDPAERAGYAAVAQQAREAIVGTSRVAANDPHNRSRFF